MSMKNVISLLQIYYKLHSFLFIIMLNIGVLQNLFFVN